VLRLQDVKVYGLEAVSFEAADGECLAVQGPSGSGKTVLLRAIADLDPAEGSIALDDRDRRIMTGPAWRSRVRFAAAEPGWWEETPRPHFRDARAIGGLLEALGLAEKTLDRPISRLSTGERQRLALIRALEDSPDVLLLDEPTGALDAKATARAEKLLKAQLKAGRTILLVSHDPQQVKRMADRKLTIRGGRVRVGRA
jgi:ABC-type multidrug transport system ATPase subunit